MIRRRYLTPILVSSIGIVFTMLIYIREENIIVRSSFFEVHLASILLFLFSIFISMGAYYLLKKEAEVEELVLKRTKALRESEERFRILLNSIPNAVITIDESGIIKFFSEIACEIFGYQKEEVLGENISILLPSPHRERHDTYLKNYLSTGVKKILGKTREEFALKKNGELFPISLIVEELRLRENRMFTAVIHDRTEQRKIERDLVEARNNAEEALKTKTDFLARMSHEIRTPLNAIIGMAHILRDTELKKEQLDHVKTITSSSENLLFVINEILDFSKIEAGKLFLEKNLYHFETAIKEVINLLQPLARKKGIELNYKIGDEVPKGVIGDSARLTQVLTNLIGNSIKFTDKGYVQLIIEAKPIDNDFYEFTLEIKDTGIGIAPTQIKNLFHTFVQADESIGKKFGGTGLGLAISKKIVELMGGDIQIDSKIGEGTTLRFNFFDKAVVEMKPPSIKDEIITINLNAEIPLSILVAEDNVINQKIVSSFLEKMGYTSDIVSNGTEVLKSLELKEYDLILMDLQMPEMDGFEAMAQIKDRIFSKRPKVVAMTANVFKEDRKRCLDLGMVDFLPKPLRKSEIELVIRRNFTSIPEREKKVTLVDLEKIKEKFLDEFELFKDIYEDLNKIHTDSINEIEKYIGEEDFKSLEKSAHSFKSVISNFEAPILREKLQEIEISAREHNIENARAQFLEFKDLYKIFHEEISRIVTDGL